MPQWLQYLTYLSPLRYFLVVLQGTYLKGLGMEILWPQMAAWVPWESACSPSPSYAVQASSQPAVFAQATKSEQKKKTETKPQPTNPAEKKDKNKDQGLAIDKIDPDVLIASDAAQDQILTVSGATDGETLTVVYESPDSKSQAPQQAVSDKGMVRMSVKLDVPGPW